LDLNKETEVFCRDLLNLVYNWDLSDLNREKANYPAIDLGDRNSRIAVQITATSGTTKVKQTYEGFLKHNLQKDYDQLFVLILTEKEQRKYPSYNTVFTFDASKHVIDLDDLLSAIESMTLSDLEVVHAYIASEMQPLIQLFADKKSLLASREKISIKFPKNCARFLKANGFPEDDPEAAEASTESLRKFQKELAAIPKVSREFLYVVALRGKVVPDAAQDRLSAVPQEVMNDLRLGWNELRDQYSVFDSNGWMDYREDSSNQHYLSIFYDDQDGTDIPYQIKVFAEQEFKDDVDEQLRKIIVEYDFSEFESD
jgi:hypothetical protein